MKFIYCFCFNNKVNTNRKGMKVATVRRDCVIELYIQMHVFISHIPFTFVVSNVTENHIYYVNVILGTNSCDWPTSNSTADSTFQCNLSFLMQ